MSQFRTSNVILGQPPEGTPNPGSAEAMDKGCLCAIYDNCRGLGRGQDGHKHGWYITEGCPLHWPRARKENVNDRP